MIQPIFDIAGTYGSVFQAQDITSEAMRQAIRQWLALYFRTEATEDADPSQRIAYTVVQKLTKTVFSEYQADSADPFAASVLDALGRVRREAVQMALIGGECLLKPVPTASGFRFTVVPRHNILVFGRDLEGRMTDIGTAEQTVQGRYYYTLLERRTVDSRGRLTVRNYLCRSTAPDTLGREVPLKALPQYAGLPERYTFPASLGCLGLAAVRTPMVNCVDGSRDAVSVYAAAVGLIHNIDRNEAQLSGEFDRGQSRVFASADLLSDRQLREHLFVGLDEDADSLGLTIFSPALREQSFLARKQEYLRNVESVIGLKRGLLSQVEAAERTATEITSSAGDYSLTVMDFQRMWEAAVREAVALCGRLGPLYRIPGAHPVAADAIRIAWGNGVLYDEDKVEAQLRAQVAAGLLLPERYLGWYYDLPCDTPEQRERIRREYMPRPVAADNALDSGQESAPHWPGIGGL